MVIFLSLAVLLNEYQGGKKVEGKRVVFRPFSFLYFGILATLFFLTLVSATSLYRGLLVEGIGIPPEAFGLVFFLSLFGTCGETQGSEIILGYMEDSSGCDGC